MRNVFRNEVCIQRVTVAMAVLLLVATAPALGQTITVNTTVDVVDFGAPQQVADLPGPDGRVSFREACIAANNAPGPQTIEFAIPFAPTEEWSGGVAILFMDFSSFQLTDDETTVDFTTQTAFTGDTNPDGNEVGVRTTPPGAGSPAIFISGDRCTIKGLDRIILCGYAVKISGNDNRVIGCTISGPLYAAVSVNGFFNGAPATGNVIGGTEPGEGNVLSAANSGVRIDGPAQNNVVIGNTLSGSFYGVEIRSPTCCPGNDAINNRIGGPTEAERNVINGAGKYGEEGFPVGGQVTVQYSIGTIVEGNYIGVNADGQTVPAVQRGPVGVEVRSSPGTIVHDNLISGILVAGVNHFAGQRFGDAIRVMGDCIGTSIEGNVIGVDATGTIALPSRVGINVVPWSVDGSPVTPGPVNIGGDAPGQGNLIANSETFGIRVASTINNVRISGNSIHSNGTLGIDLLVGFQQTGGVSPNDAGDGDTGANGLQNFPVLTAAQSDGMMTTTIEGSLNSAPNAAYGLEFFANDVCDPSGNGEGRTFLGGASVATDASGNAAFAVVLPVPVEEGEFVTATAADSLGNTSEFSECRIAESVGSLGDCDGNGIVNLVDFATFSNCFGLTAPSAACDASDFACSDLDQNGAINLVDFATFATNFNG